MSASRLGRAVAIVGVAVSLTMVGTAGSAVAGSSGAPVATKGGSALITERTSVTITDTPQTQSGMATTLATTEKVGGGTWTYGRRATTFPNDRCFSNYVHNSTYHSATTIFGDGNSKKFADPSLYANTYVDKNGFTTSGCRAYWNTY